MTEITINVKLPIKPVETVSVLWSCTRSELHDGLVEAVRITRCPGASTACVQVSTEGHVPVVHANEEAVEIARLVSGN